MLPATSPDEPMGPHSPVQLAAPGGCQWAAASWAPTKEAAEAEATGAAGEGWGWLWPGWSVAVLRAAAAGAAMTDSAGWQYRAQHRLAGAAAGGDAGAAAAGGAKGGAGGVVAAGAGRAGVRTQAAPQGRVSEWGCHGKWRRGDEGGGGLGSHAPRAEQSGQLRRFGVAIAPAEIAVGETVILLLPPPPPFNMDGEGTSVK